MKKFNIGCIGARTTAFKTVRFDELTMQRHGINKDDFPDCEYAKFVIGNEIDNCKCFFNSGYLYDGQLTLDRRTLILFQFDGKIIGSGILHIDWVHIPYSHQEFFLEDALVFPGDITGNELRQVVKEFKRFNSTAQIIDRRYLDDILDLCKKKAENSFYALPSNCSIICDEAEGNRIEYYTTKYERIPKYRKEAIRIHGLTCKICGDNFKNKSGDLGKDYIEIHHVKPLFSLDEEIIPNPKTDMIPVCANCHRMLHRRKFEIVEPEELKRIVEENREDAI